MVEVLEGDCFGVLAGMEACGVDAVVTDPPYFLGFMNKGWDLANPKALDCDGSPGSRGYGCKAGESSAIARRNSMAAQVWHQQWAAKALRVAKPGAHLVAFGGTRTYHRLACAVEDAGWEVRDCLMYVFGVGFPKSHNLHGEWEGWGTALKPGYEPIILARKPLEGTVAANVEKWGVGALNIDGCRVATGDGLGGGAYSGGERPTPFLNGGLYRKRPVEFRQPKGRWPANLVHDGSQEVLDLFPQGVSRRSDTPQPVKTSRGHKGGAFGNPSACRPDGHPVHADYVRGGFGDAGSAARFFYCAKASRKERGEGNTHPTVKPVALMRYLIRLVCPPGGLVLDPFAGSGTTGVAAGLEGMRCVLIEREGEYCEMARGRLAADVLPLLE